MNTAKEDIRFSSNPSPSLYAEIFDDNNHSDLATNSDPLLGTGQSENAYVAENRKEMLQENSELNFGPVMGNQIKSELMDDIASNFIDTSNIYESNNATPSTSARTGEQVLPLLPNSVGIIQQQPPTPRVELNYQKQPAIRVKMEPMDQYYFTGLQPSNDGQLMNHDYDGQVSSSNSRGAQYAREYRRKKKRRMSQLETDNERLWRENKALKHAYKNVCDKTAMMEHEISYLRRILANDSAVAKLLDQVVAKSPGLKFQWSPGGDRG